ncbi:MAG: 23S rRNA (adenine(2503)-C(2))-methyltransferase RlmN [Clostridiales bacterium]|nr:23S rRNA (adenine(2503)-C(2))-methyltransferase RlmN [Clostridiales bacterium]
MDKSRDELAELLTAWGEPLFRAKQVYGWLLRGARPQAMTNLPKALREKLDALPFGGVSVHSKFVSTRDGTVKYLFALEDGNLVEGVLMRYRYGNTLCLSTQVGCKMGCVFCASTLDGCVRDLRHGEMLGFVAAVEADEPAKAGERTVTNIVLMGSGEPLDNYDNVVRFLWRVTGDLGISARNISLSTCGIVPMMRRFASEAPPVTLSVSLHAATDAQRSKLMPINAAYPIREVVTAAHAYAEQTGRRVIFEYALIAGENDSQADAKALANLLAHTLCHVNLIPLNPVAERDLQGTTRAQAQRFAGWLADYRVSATVRREMGTDIAGACGQLRRKVLK